VTASATVWLQLTTACFEAMLVPTLFSDTSIPDPLKDRLLAQRQRRGTVDRSTRCKSMQVDDGRRVRVDVRGCAHAAQNQVAMKLPAVNDG
jgi:hypothetical protein